MRDGSCLSTRGCLCRAASHAAFLARYPWFSRANSARFAWESMDLLKIARSERFLNKPSPFYVVDLDNLTQFRSGARQIALRLHRDGIPGMDDSVAHDAWMRARNCDTVPDARVSINDTQTYISCCRSCEDSNCAHCTRIRIGLRNDESCQTKTTK
jgi:hypothetical protein